MHNFALLCIFQYFSTDISGMVSLRAKLKKTKKVLFSILVLVRFSPICISEFLCIILHFYAYFGSFGTISACSEGLTEKLMKTNYIFTNVTSSLICIFAFVCIFLHLYA